MQVQINRLLRESLVLLDVDVGDRCDAFKMATALLSEHGFLAPNGERLLYDMICQTEDQAGTGVGKGVALPHAYSEGLSEPVLIVLRSKTGLDFEGPDDAPVDLMLLLVGPHRDNIEHLRIIAKLSRLLKDPDLTRRVRAAKEAREVLEAFGDIEKRH